MDRSRAGRQGGQKNVHTKVLRVLGRVAEAVDCGFSLDGEGRESRREMVQGKVRT